MFGDRLFEDSDDETVHDMQNLFEVALLQFDTVRKFNKNSSFCIINLD